MNSNQVVQVIRSYMRQTWNGKSNPIMRQERIFNPPTPSRQYREFAADVHAAADKILKSLFSDLLDILQTTSQKAAGLYAFMEKQTEDLLEVFNEWENEIALRTLDGLLESLKIRVSSGAIFDKQTGRSSIICEVPENLESVRMMNLVYEAQTPIQRFDIGLRGVAGVREYSRWFEREVNLHGDPRPGMIEGLRSVIQEVQKSQLAWKSFLVVPCDPEDQLPEKLVKVIKPAPEEDIYKHLLELFRPLSDFDPDEWIRFLTKVGLGQDELLALLPQTFKSEELLSNLGVSWQMFDVIGLGVGPKPGKKDLFADLDLDKWGSPEYFPMLAMNTVEQLRRKLLPVVSEPGQEIRLVTTYMPIKRQHFQAMIGQVDSEVEKIGKMVKKDNRVSNARRLHQLALKMARTLVVGSQHKPFQRSVRIAVKGTSHEQMLRLAADVRTQLTEMGIYFREPQHRVDKMESIKALLPTIRDRETSKMVSLCPSGISKEVFREIKSSATIKEGVFLGRILETFVDGQDVEPVQRDEALISKLGGNSVYCGAPGSGKSMGAKLETDRTLGMNKHLFGRLMENTEAATLEAPQLRGWRGLVDGYNGTIIEARNFESTEQLRKYLKEITLAKVRLVLFVSQDIRPELDEVYLRWMLQDIQINNPGIVVIDECANWFKYQEDTRGALYVEHLMNQFTANSYRSITTVQVLGSIRETIAHRGTYRQMMGLAQAGIYVFYTPDSGSLKWDLNINTDVYPNLDRYVVSRIDSLKTDPTGPVDKPGYGILYSPGRAAFFKMESEEDTLRRFARKDPESHETLWGL